MKLNKFKWAIQKGCLDSKRKTAWPKALLLLIPSTNTAKEVTLSFAWKTTVASPFASV
jgi:hypothetical protein